MGQALHVQVLAQPAEPLGPRSPRPVLNAALAAFFRLVAALVFVRDAIGRNR